MAITPKLEIFLPFENNNNIANVKMVDPNMRIIIELNEQYIKYTKNVRLNCYSFIIFFCKNKMCWRQNYVTVTIELLNF